MRLVVVSLVGVDLVVDVYCVLFVAFFLIGFEIYLFGDFVAFVIGFEIYLFDFVIVLAFVFGIVILVFVFCCLLLIWVPADFLLV